VRTLRGRLFAATLAALALTLTLTIAIGAVLTRRQVDRAQVNSLARRADDLALERRKSVSYINSNNVSGQVRVIVSPRPALAAYVPDVDRSSNGETTFEGKRYLYSYRTLPSRGMLLLRRSNSKSAAWQPFLRDLLLAALAGAGLAAGLSFVLARSIVRPIRRVAEASQAIAADQTHTPLPETGSRELASLAQAFNEMAEQLAASRETERTFLLSVSHELKTPLTAIRGYAEGLGEGAFTADEAARTIVLESRRLERLVRDLLDLARMNRSEFSVRCEPIDLAEVAREAVARHEAAAREFGVALGAEGEETWVEADHDRVLQIASNLVENALRETPPGGTVTVGAVTVGTLGAGIRGRRLAVSDTGPGLELDDLPRAFDRFFLYDKYGRERPVGSGLGLAIVKQLALAMGGEVSVESEPGRGTTFVLTLPSGPKARRVDHLEVGSVQST
jgi:two-component system, OmpR family, sensor kinase